MVCAIISDRYEQHFACKNENEKPYTAIKAALREEIWKLYREGYDEFTVNCEYGIPLWSAEIIAALKMYNDIRLCITVPYEEQCRDWSEELRDRYYSVHASADEVIMCSPHYSAECYNKADEEMIDRSDMLMLFSGYDETVYAEAYAHRYDVEIKKLRL